LLKETGRTASKPANTLVDPNTKLGSEEDGLAVHKEMYQRLVGRLIYLSHAKPDIAFFEPSKSIYASTKGNTFKLLLELSSI